MKFELSKEEEKMVREWEENHKCTERNKSCCGGEITYSFTPTSIGTAVDAVCVCGQSLTVREL